jgi:hypothetical protein
MGFVCSWARERGLQIDESEPLAVSVKVKKDQLADFVEYVYGKDPSYKDPAKMLTWKGKAYLVHQLDDLRAFVAQELNPRLWYKLKADEF